jgi:hypothetical protein
MGHAEPQVATTMQSFWMPFSPNKEFKAEPRMFSRAKGMYFYTPEGRRRWTSPPPSCAGTPSPSSWRSAWRTTRPRA